MFKHRACSIRWCSLFFGVFFLVLVVEVWYLAGTERIIYETFGRLQLFVEAGEAVPTAVVVISVREAKQRRAHIRKQLRQFEHTIATTLMDAVTVKSLRAKHKAFSRQVFGT
jgi:dolichyl-phosphate-mannose--protein O-mannosyl transferase